MTTVLTQLSEEMGNVADGARRSLVQIHNGRRGAGSGVIWNAGGLIVTNAHVVQSRRWHKGPDGGLRVTLPGGNTLSARLLASDENIDVAALAVEAEDLAPLELGDSKALRPGQWVLALGYPFGVPGAACAGAVIGIGPDLPERPAQGHDLIATSLRVRPGDSGGPLVDGRGRLVGINSMMAGPEVGLAVPVHVIKDFLRREVEAGIRV